MKPFHARGFTESLASVLHEPKQGPHKALIEQLCEAPRQEVLQSPLPRGFVKLETKELSQTTKEGACHAPQ